LNDSGKMNSNCTNNNNKQVQGLCLTLVESGFFTSLKSDQRKDYNMINTFNPSIATAYNINAAIFIQSLAQWTFRNLANRDHIHDGYCWSFNTLQAYEEMFPWWSRRQLETIIAGLVKEGLILKGNYNKHKYDRTCWYALTEKSLAFFPEISTDTHLQILAESISPNCEMYDTALSHDENMQLHFTKMRNGVHENVTTIPTSNTTNNISKDILGNEDNNVNGQISKPPKGVFGVIELQANNPHDISEPMLTDWLEVRKAKKNKVTSTAWNKINRTLTAIHKELGINPIEAFETMVASGWQSLEIKYFQNNSNGNAGNKSQGTGIKDYNGNDITWE
jgi:hypothetical protein